MYGPLFKEMESAFFGSDAVGKFFVKKIPVSDRPSLLERLFGEQQCVIGDFSSFESHMRAEFADAIHFGMSWIAGGKLTPQMAECLRVHMTTVNQSWFKQSGVRVQVPQTLMSGAVWTSLANCMLSFGLVTYMRLRAKFPHMQPTELATHLDDVVAVFEGDDSLCLGGAYDTDLINALGLLLKSKVVNNFGEGDFCGITRPFRSPALFTDPVKVFCNMFVVPEQYMDAKASKQDGLLRAKALSLYWLYSSCPVVGALCFAVLNRTRGKRLCTQHLSHHQQEILSQVKGKFHMQEPRPATPQDREAFERLYNISPTEQVAFEKALSAWGLGSQVAFRLPDVFIPYSMWSDSYLTYEKTWPMPSWRGDRLQQMDRLVGAGPVLLAPFLLSGELVAAKFHVTRSQANTTFYADSLVRRTKTNPAIAGVVARP